ncbi:FimV/HubP family polar landmark protein [Castellaniella sp.]|uniref:type IV pilus assembly protein FimV n=1 Tax=Castellaniella sp. TaxID=1955812 RepID=UPI002AFE1FB2|nr:FimV/HubP family polar landmark protein [Castellaniella sp.]
MVGAARLIGGLLSLACLVGSPVHAADFGHARLVSTAGAPLLITLPITGLTPADLQTLSARPAPAADWANAGLTPPVALDSLIVSVAASPRPGASRILRIHSNQPFVGSLADLLLDVQTASGQQRHQVSLLVPGPVTAVAPPAGGAAVAATQRSAPATGAASAATSSRRVPAGTITVRRGDTMFAVARRHAVDQVSVYQLMLALQRANPQAFIHDNINLLRSDTVLAVPSIDDMLSISDAEARRQFVAQTAAFNRLRGGLAAADAPLAGQAGAGDVAVAATPVAAEKPVAADRLQLSQTNQSAADAQAAQGHALKDAESRVGQLQDNVQHLNQALQAQGEAARDVVADGAQAVTASIGKVASAISEASREAAAQADAQLNAQATQAGSEAAPAGSAAAPDGTAAQQPSPSAALSNGGSSSSAAQSNGSNGGAAQGTNAVADTRANAPAQASTSANAAASTASVGGLGLPGEPGPASAATAAQAQAADLVESPKTQSRVSWIQEHLLAILIGLLVIIVFLIAWLLRRANTTRDEADAGQGITDAMVRERLQGVDLDLPPRETSDSATRY